MCLLKHTSNSQKMKNIGRRYDILITTPLSSVAKAAFESCKSFQMLWGNFFKWLVFASASSWIALSLLRKFRRYVMSNWKLLSCVFFYANYWDYNLKSSVLIHNWRQLLLCDRCCLTKKATHASTQNSQLWSHLFSNTLRTLGMDSKAVGSSTNVHNTHGLAVC